MGWKCGIVGLPNSGKSTLFNSFVGSGAQVAEYPFTTIDPNIGVVLLPDSRLDAVAEISGSATKTPTAIEVVDIAGLVKGAHAGEGLGNRFLSHIRGTDAILHVVRSFTAPRVPHTMGRIDAADDAAVVDLELVLADLEVVERRLARISKAVKSGDSSRQELSALEKAREALGQGKPVRLASLSDEERLAVQGMALLTGKPCVYVVNVPEEFAGAPERAPGYATVEKYASAAGAMVCGLSCKIESELSELPLEEAGVFASEIGISERGTDRLVRLGYRLLDLITFFTANDNEARAWTLERGLCVLDAAARVHTDMAQGFIRAIVTPSADLMKAGSYAKARLAGATRIEGKEYVVKDGDVVLIRFNPA
ncbi:MAG: redox-regulated ATPase YchF [Bacillota bacterium]|nr:redox-regulated ATPase YchF [Bacillota bacterium]